MTLTSCTKNLHVLIKTTAYTNLGQKSYVLAFSPIFDLVVKGNHLTNHDST